MSGVDSLGNTPDRRGVAGTRRNRRTSSTSQQAADGSEAPAPRTELESGTVPGAEEVGAGSGFAAAVARSAAAGRRRRDTEASVEEMLDVLHHAGDELKRGGSADRVRRYKAAVREFVEHILSHALEVERTHSPLGVHQRKSYLLVSVIDQKLERLASAVLQRQTMQMEIVRRVDEINGLLVDLVS